MVFANQNSFELDLMASLLKFIFFLLRRVLIVQVLLKYGGNGGLELDF